MKFLYITVLAWLTLQGSSFSQVQDQVETTKRVHQYLAAMDSVGLTGAALVELNGKPIISKGYGYSDKEQQIKNTAETVFDIGSVTKQFTATAILKLEMQGKLSTDDKISKYFKNVPEDKKSITIHDLLRHQSGLISNVGKDYEPITETVFLEKVLASKLQFVPGTSFAYSNTGYSLLAMIVEQVSGTNYENFLYEALWRPSGMEMTGYTRPKFDTRQIAVGYYRNDSIWGKPTGKAWDKTAPYWHLKGNGGILSTISDLYRWHQSLMTDKIISAEAKNKLYHPQTRQGESAQAIYAYGWDVSKTKRNTTLVWHNGTNRIFYADFLRFIDEKCTLILLTNKLHPNYDRLCFEIAKIIFNPDYKPEIPVADTKLNRNFTTRIIKAIEDSGLAKAKVLYSEKSKDELLLEFMMRDEGFKRIDNNQPENAIQVFEMNAFAYPASSKALQGLGEGYMETGKNDLALKYLKQSLEINADNPFVKDMIAKLEGE